MIGFNLTFRIKLVQSLVSRQSSLEFLTCFYRDCFWLKNGQFEVVAENFPAASCEETVRNNIGAELEQLASGLVCGLGLVTITRLDWISPVRSSRASLCYWLEVIFGEMAARPPQNVTRQPRIGAVLLPD